MGELERQWKNNTLETFKHRFDKVKLVILDEMGYVPFTKEGAELLFQLISDWYETKSIIITSNLEFSQWNKVFIDTRLTAALVDRLIHHAHILSFTGEGFRLKNALSRPKNNQRKISGAKVCTFSLQYYCRKVLQNTSFTYKQNKTVLESKTNGVSLFLFEVLQPKKYI